MGHLSHGYVTNNQAGYKAFQGALPHGTFPFASTSEFTGYVEGQADQERVPSAWCTTLQVLVPGGQAGWSSVVFLGGVILAECVECVEYQNIYVICFLCLDLEIGIDGYHSGSIWFDGI